MLKINTNGTIYLGAVGPAVVEVDFVATAAAASPLHGVSPTRTQVFREEKEKAFSKYVSRMVHKYDVTVRNAQQDNGNVALAIDSATGNGLLMTHILGGEEGRPGASEVDYIWRTNVKECSTAYR